MAPGAPKRESLEVSVFGPGFGECVALHYGEGRWIVIDSCVDKVERRPAALVYFDEIGVDPSDAISHVIITHPDNDHISGAAELFRQCSSAKLVLPVVFSRSEMAAYAAFFYRDDTSELTRATSEYVEMLKELALRNSKPMFIKQDTAIVLGDVSILALSPSDAKMDSFLTYVSTLIPKERDPVKRPPSLSHNAVSAVLLVQTSDESVILGADLEENPGGGWSTILTESLYFNESPPTSLIKVPHHGSENADSSDLWLTFAADSYAVLTPFNKGRKRLPSRTDVDRICARTANAYSTSTYRAMRLPRDRELERAVSSMGIKRLRSEPKTGHVRLRKMLNDPVGDWTVQLFKGADRLSEVHG